MAVLITGIGELTTNDPGLGRLTGAALVVEGGKVAWVGPADRDVGQGVDQVGPANRDPVVLDRVTRHQDRDRKAIWNR